MNNLPSQVDTMSIKGMPPIQAVPGKTPNTTKGSNSIVGEYPIYTYINRTGNN